MQVPQPTPGEQHISVVIPVLNEEAAIARLLDRLIPVLQSTGMAFDVMFVDDGSTDGTLSFLRALNAGDPRIKAIALSRNFGKEIAVAAGLTYATGDATIVMDADLQHPPEVIPSLIAKWREGHDVVFGQRINRDSDSLWRRAGARVFYRTFRHLSGTALQQDSCDFRLFSRKAIAAINRLGERKRYNNGLFAWIGFPAVGVPFDMGPRVEGGKSRWAPARLLRFALDGLASFSTIPLRVWSVLGLSISGLAFLVMLWVAIKTIVFGDPVRGYPTLMIAILFFSGIQLISLGVIGEYLGRVYEEVKARPLFLVREELGFPAPPAGRMETPAAPGPKT
jgi:polyisoprenyl-phosphate glycosyltransferase